MRVEATSLNYRDLIVRDAATQNPVPRVPLSDAAGVVDAIGAGVTRWKAGDRVAANFFRDWVDGPARMDDLKSALGGASLDGVLADYIVLPEHWFVAQPKYLSSQESATLPCAALTAWHALVVRGQLAKDDWVLVQGTGGVALFGLQIAVAHGAKVVVISSSDDKLRRAQAMGAVVGINYRTAPEWDRAVRKATGEGADHILELGGPDTYERSLRALRPGGSIAQIGVLTGFGAQPNLARLQSINGNIHGITVGSVAHFTAMNAFFEKHAIKPAIDRVFAFEDAPSA